MNKPNTKPNNPNFSSGPTSKRPGWDISVLSNALTGRSHRSVECKARLKEAIDKSKDILKLPDDYLLGIMPGSNTGALEAAMWCLLGKTGVDILAWENFGKDWVIDAISELKLDNFHERNIGSGININAESSSESCCTESIDIDKILFQLKRNGEFKNVGDSNKFGWRKNNKK